MMDDQPDYIAKLGMLPPHMRSGMRRWVELGVNSRPGSFLFAVVSNDLMEACGRADHENAQALPAYAVYLYNYAPSDCYGSRKNAESWQGIFAGKVEK